MDIWKRTVFFRLGMDDCIFAFHFDPVHLEITISNINVMHCSSCIFINIIKIQVLRYLETSVIVAYNRTPEPCGFRL